MADSKDQHFIPKLILREFAEEGESVWVYTNERGIERRNIKTVFVRRHLYTRKSVDIVNRASRSTNPRTFEQSIRKDDFVYDQMITKMETKADPVLKQVIQQARLRECPHLSPDQAAIIKEFVLLMARRTPEAQDRLRSKNHDSGWFYDIVKSVADSKKHPLPNRHYLQENNPFYPKFESLALSNVSSQFAAGVYPEMQKEVRRFCRETGIQVLRAPRHGFIIGSHGISISVQYKSENKRYSAVGALPVAPDVAIGPTLTPNQEDLVFLQNYEIRPFNVGCAEHSSMIAGLKKRTCKSTPDTFEPTSKQHLRSDTQYQLNEEQ